MLFSGSVSVPLLFIPSLPAKVVTLTLLSVSKFIVETVIDPKASLTGVVNQTLQSVQQKVELVNHAVDTLQECVQQKVGFVNHAVDVVQDYAQQKVGLGFVNHVVDTLQECAQQKIGFVNQVVDAIQASAQQKVEIVGHAVDQFFHNA